MNQPVTRVRVRSRIKPIQSQAAAFLSLIIVAYLLYLLGKPGLARFDTAVGEGIRGRKLTLYLRLTVSAFPAAMQPLPLLCSVMLPLPFFMRSRFVDS